MLGPGVAETNCAGFTCSVGNRPVNYLPSAFSSQNVPTGPSIASDVFCGPRLPVGQDGNSLLQLG